MAARNSSRMSTPAVSQTASPRRPTRWTLTTPEPQPAIRAGLVPRVIYFPAGWLARIEDKPGALVELITLALSAYQAKGGAQ